MTFKFSATRFNHSESAAKPQIGTSTVQMASKSTNLTLLSTPNLSLHKLSKASPKLQHGETLLGYSIAAQGIAILITNLRVLLYDTGNFEDSYPLEFIHDSSTPSSSITSLVTLIPNPSIESKPHLAIVNPITGTLKFIESLNFIPSLTVVQNQSLINLPLHSNEIITSIDYQLHIGLLVSTSQKRVILVSFFDSLGNINISSSQIFNDRSIFNYILSKDLTTQKSITSLKLFSQSPVIKKLFILESNNTLFILNHIISSGIFTLANKFDLNNLLELNGWSSIHDIKISNNGHSIVALIKSNIGSFFIVEINLSSMSIETSYEIHLFNTFQDGNFHFINEPNVLLLELIDHSNVSKLITVDLLNKINMDQIICFKHNLKIFSINSQLNDKCFKIGTNYGVLILNYYSIPNQTDIIQSITSRIEQYLLFNYQESPVSYNILDSGIEINQFQIQSAIEEIISNILNNKLLKTNSKSTEIPIENLLKRMKLIKNFVVFISHNYNLSQNIFEKLLESSSLLSLSYHFLTAVQNKDLVDKAFSLIKNSTSKSIGHHIINNCSSIIDLISEFIDSSLPLGNERQIVELSSLLNDTFSDGYFEIEVYVKSILKVKGLASPIFINHFDLLKKINSITGHLFNVAVETDKMDGMNAISDIVSDSIFGLSRMLYYSINDSITYQLSNSQPTEKFESFLKSNKQNWVQSFCVLNRQDEILQSADEYEDMDSLSILIDSQREEIYEQELYQRNLAESKGDILFDIPNDLVDKQGKVELLFDHYFTKYGYIFASSLFNYYVSKGNINHLLSNFNEEKYIHFLNQFLNENYDNGYYKFGWIRDIRNGFYSTTSQKLIYHVDKFNDNITNKQLLLSIAKLSAIAAEGSNDSTLVGNQLLISNSDSKLKTLAIQMKIQDLFDELSLRKNSNNQSITELIKLDNKFIKDIDNVISLFESKMEVPIIPLINVSTLLLLQKEFVNDQTFDKVIEYLVEILESTDDDHILDIGNKLIWRRVLLWNKEEIGANSEELSSIKFIQYIVEYKDKMKLTIPKYVSQLKIENVPDFDDEFDELNALLSNWDVFSSLGEF